MALVFSFGIGLFFQAFLICRPFAKNWEPLLPGTCGSSRASFLADGAINIIIDLAMVILPMPMVWQLQMSHQRKISLTIVFALGILYVFASRRFCFIILTLGNRVCMITIVRVIVFVHFNVDDFTYGIAKVAILTDLETCMGIIVACLPMFPPTFKRMLRGKKPADFRNHISSSVARLRSKDSKAPAAFRKIDDLYPLTELDDMRTQNDITGPDGKPGSFVDGQNTSDTKLEMHYPQSTIKIKQGWEVRSDEAV